MPTVSFRNELIDIGEQLMLLGEHWKSLLEADTKVAFQNGLHRLHHSTEVMQVCVSGLMHRLASHSGTRMKRKILPSPLISRREPLQKGINAGANKGTFEETRAGLRMGCHWPQVADCSTDIWQPVQPLSDERSIDEHALVFPASRLLSWLLPLLRQLR